jgi:glycosyltransferase involved in cell wall biosynthesis
MLPLVSVIIPCYERDEYYGQSGSIQGAVRTALAQEAPVEVIVIDDGSPIKGAIRKALGPMIEAVRFIEYDTNKGTAGARNVGISEAKGEFIFPLDGDDQMAPHAIWKLRQTLLHHPSAGVAYGNIQDFKYLTMAWFTRVGWTLYDMTKGNPVPSASMFRKEVWEAVGGYDESNKGFEDWLFWMEAGRKGYQFVKIEEYTVLHQAEGEHQTQWLHRNRKERIDYMMSKIPDIFIPTEGFNLHPISKYAWS